MITVGLVKELYFIAKTLNKVYSFELAPVGSGGWYLAPLSIVISPDAKMEIWYKATHIWSEVVDGVESFFGVESCDTISRIIACINNKDNSWREKYYQGKEPDWVWPKLPAQSS